MSSLNPDGSINPEDNLTPAELESRDRLEAIVQHGLGTNLQVGHALAEIRDRHLYRAGYPSFEAYVRERWGVIPSSDVLSEATIGADAPALPGTALEPRVERPNSPCDVLAQACEQTLSALADDERTRIEIRLAVRMRKDLAEAIDEERVDARTVVEAAGEDLVPKLRWLMTQAAGTIGEVAHRLETSAADVDDDARDQLRDDLLVLDGELSVVRALLADFIDWDSELTQLLSDEVPPRDTDADPDDE